MQEAKTKDNATYQFRLFRGVNKKMEKLITFKSFTKQNGGLTNFIRDSITGHAYRLL